MDIVWEVCNRKKQEVDTEYMSSKRPRPKVWRRQTLD
jgi:hypothetical protein